MSSDHESGQQLVISASPPGADRTATSAAWLSWLGVAYLLLCLWVILNPLLVSAGWPLPHSASLLGGTEPGAHGLNLLALCGLAVGVSTATCGTLVRGQRWLLLALGAWMVGPALSLAILGSLQDGRYWAVAVSAVSVGFAAAAVRPDHLSRLLRALGWVFGWGSVVAGFSQLLIGWPVVLIAGDPRHVQWLAQVGISLDSVTILNGLSPGRLFLSMTCGVLFVAIWRQPRRPASLWMRRILLAGLVLAMVWSAGRVGFIAITMGAAASIVPWQKGPRWLAFVAALAIPTMPLVASQVLHTGENSAQWRFDLWSSYFDRSGLWAPFGLGPQPPPTAIRGHAHNQFLEALSAGGWISLAGLLVFLYLGLKVARGAHDNHMTYGVIFAMCGIFAFDVVTFAPTSLAPNSAFVIGVAVIVHAAGSPPHHRLLRETPDAIHA